MKHYYLAATAIVAVVLLFGCSGSKGFVLPEKDEKSPRRTCLVLSVGGPHGVAHIGAINAIREREVGVDCVGGASMGALVGVLYASNPTANLEKEMASLLRKYIKKTKSEKRGSAVGGALIAGGIVALSGGTAWPILLGGAAGGLAGAVTVEKMDLSRFAGVLHRHLKKKSFGQLAIPFTTFYSPVKEKAPKVVTVSAGRVAAAVKKSIANPMIFTNFNPIKAGYLDPGVDRMAAVPIEDMCRRYPDSQILAVNVTGSAPVYDSQLPCPVKLIEIPRTRHKASSIFTDRKVRRKVVKHGYLHTLAALSK